MSHRFYTLDATEGVSNDGNILVRETMGESVQQNKNRDVLIATATSKSNRAMSTESEQKDEDATEIANQGNGGVLLATVNAVIRYTVYGGSQKYNAQEDSDMIGTALKIGHKFSTSWSRLLREYDHSPILYGVMGGGSDYPSQRTQFHLLTFARKYAFNLCIGRSTPMF